VLYTCVLWKLFGKYCSALFQILLCEVSGRCFGTSERCSCMSRWLFWLSRRYGLFDRTVILLVQTSVFLWPLRGTTSERHLSSVRTVNPVGLNRFLLAPQPICSHLLIHFCSLVTFLCAFYAKFYSTHVIFAVYLHSSYISVLVD
jgi:hypothetical protein